MCQCQWISSSASIFSRPILNVVEAELELETCCELRGELLNLIPNIYHACFLTGQIAFICTDACPARGGLRVQPTGIADSPGQYAAAGKGVCLLLGPLAGYSAHCARMRGYVVSQGWSPRGCMTNSTSPKDVNLGTRSVLIVAIINIDVLTHLRTSPTILLVVGIGTSLAAGTTCWLAGKDKRGVWKFSMQMKAISTRCRTSRSYRHVLDRK